MKQLSEQQLRDFKNFLASELADELIAGEGPKLALKDVEQCGRGRTGRKASLAKQARKTNKGVHMRLQKSGNQHLYRSTIAFKNFHISSKYVKTLDLAIDFHISLVRIQHKVLASRIWFVEAVTRWRRTGLQQASNALV